MILPVYSLWFVKHQGTIRVFATPGLLNSCREDQSKRIPNGKPYDAQELKEETALTCWFVAEELEQGRRPHSPYEMYLTGYVSDAKWKVNEIHATPALDMCSAQVIDLDALYEEDWMDGIERDQGIEIPLHLCRPDELPPETVELYGNLDGKIQLNPFG